MRVARNNNIFNRFGSWVGEKIAAPNDFFSRTSERSRDTLVLTTSAGVAVGAAVGVAGGALSTALNEKTESIAQKEIVDPKFLGHRYWTREDTYEDCSTDFDGDEHCTTETDGWYHNYEARFEERVVGHYGKPDFGNTHSWQPLTGGLVGAAAGGLVGLGVGISINLMRKLKDDSSPVQIPRQKRREIAEKTSGNLAKGALIGAGAGVLLGGAAGLLESAKGDVVERQWMAPVTQRELMGHIPPDSYENTFSFRPSDRSDAAETEPVYRNVPVYDAEGKPTLEQTSARFETARFGPVTGALVGGLIGAGAGLAGGVAASVIQKVASYD